MTAAGPIRSTACSRKVIRRTPWRWPPPSAPPPNSGCPGAPRPSCMRAPTGCGTPKPPRAATAPRPMSRTRLERAKLYPALAILTGKLTMTALAGRQRGVISWRASGHCEPGRVFKGKGPMKRSRAALSFLFAIISFAAFGADYPSPKQGDFIAKDFKFHTGEVMEELKLHYTTVGEPSGLPVLVLHGTGGSAASMPTPSFARVLFGPGQPLDASKYYIIIPDP